MGGIVTSGAVISFLSRNLGGRFDADGPRDGEAGSAASGKLTCLRVWAVAGRNGGVG